MFARRGGPESCCLYPRGFWRGRQHLSWTKLNIFARALLRAGAALTEPTPATRSERSTPNFRPTTSWFWRRLSNHAWPSTACLGVGTAFTHACLRSRSQPATRPVALPTGRSSAVCRLNRRCACDDGTTRPSRRCWNTSFAARCTSSGLVLFFVLPMRASGGGNGSPTTFCGAKLVCIILRAAFCLVMPYWGVQMSGISITPPASAVRRLIGNGERH